MCLGAQFTREHATATAAGKVPNKQSGASACEWCAVGRELGFLVPTITLAYQNTRIFYFIFMLNQKYTRCILFICFECEVSTLIPEPQHEIAHSQY